MRSHALPNFPDPDSDELAGLIHEYQAISA
jgi:hypothetical protein